VFSNGQAWQFKGWKWGDPTDCLSKGTLVSSVLMLLILSVAGFYLHFDDEKLPEAVTKWAVKRLPVCVFLFAIVMVMLTFV